MVRARPVFNENRGKILHQAACLMAFTAMFLGTYVEALGQSRVEYGPR